jgi:hypothetical protein
MTFALRATALKSPPSWAHERLEAYDEVKHVAIAAFLKAEHWCADESINVHAVVGTRNSSYFDWTWLEFIQNGKRMESVNLPLFESNPAYYTEATIKLPPMSFITIDGTNLYLDADGNHRTCIARFAFAQTGRTQLAGVGVTRLEVDWPMLAAFEEMQRLIALKRLPFSISAARTSLGREDSGGWKVDRYRPYIAIVDVKRGITEGFDLAGAKAWISNNSASWWTKVLGKRK